MRYNAEIKEGFVYVMTNPSLLELVKVGASTNVEARRITLSQTLPYAYVLHHAEQVSDMWAAEKRAHAALVSRQVGDSEFFRCTPEEAVAAVRGVRLGLEAPHVRHAQDIGSFIRKARKRNTLTLQQLADMVDTSRGVIQRLENGEIGGTRLRTFLSVCDALSLTLHISAAGSDATPF